MTDDKPTAKPPTRQRVLDAAENLLVQGGAGFSMRDLADAAGVSFATPFNTFGSKGAIMLALSARRIAAMGERLRQAHLPDAAPARVLIAADLASAVMLETPVVSRAVMSAVGAPSDQASDVSSQSSLYWAEALGAGLGLDAKTRRCAVAVLPFQLAVGFRGVLSFWTAGELSDRDLGPCAQSAAATVLLGFADRKGRADLLARLEGGSSSWVGKVRAQ